MGGQSRRVDGEHDLAERQRSRPGSGTAPEVADGAVPTAARLSAPAPRGRGLGPARVAMMRQAQQTLGNGAIQRVLQRASVASVQAEVAPEGPAVQRTPGIIIDDGEEQELEHEEQALQRSAESMPSRTVQRKPDVPGLSAATETTAKSLLSGSATDKQAAIDAVVKNMVKNGEFSLSKITDKQVKYEAGTVGEGLTTSTFKNGKAVESKMEIGDAAFASVGWLYSSLLHEYKHVQQHFALKSVAGWDEDFAEVQAYALEIKKAKNTGATKAQMEDLWRRLHGAYWVNITDAKKKKTLKPLVTSAHKIAEKATGKTLTLTL